MIYKSKPFHVDAYKIVAIENLIGETSTTANYVASLDNGTDFILMPVNYGQHEPQPGDYLIFQSPTDRYVCPAHVFEAKYEKCDEQEKEEQPA